MVRGENVCYFDVYDTDTLKARADQFGLCASTVPKIDYTDPTGNLDVIDRQFDIVLSSHSVEHQPDLIRHFQKVERLLRGGVCTSCLFPIKDIALQRSLM